MVTVSINIPYPIDIVNTAVTPVSHMVKFKFTETITECQLPTVIQVLMLNEYYRVFLNSSLNFCEFRVIQTVSDINIQNFYAKIVV